MELLKAKQECDQYLDSKMDELWKVAQFIHANPELAFQEEKACKIQCDYLEDNDFDVKRGVAGLATAYTATYENKKGDLHIGIVSEYDALPIGHGCGHNLIATTALGSAIELKEFLKRNDIAGKITVFGTPAEEGGGGKIIMLDHHIFDGTDVVFMMHPTSAPTRLAGECMSSKRIEITFKGKSAHAGSHPENGINALSAANLFMVATGMLRQHFKGDARLSMIITNGGEASGLIPELAQLKGSLSCFSLKDLEKYKSMVEYCAKGCAMAMGCEVEIEIVDGYQGRIPNKTLSDLCKVEMRALDEPLLDGMPFDYGGEDLGNVSRLIPICNPYVTIFPDYKISNHTEQFRELANSPAGYRCIQIGSKAMARTAMELFMYPEIVEKAKEELKERLKNEE